MTYAGANHMIKTRSNTRQILARLDALEAQVQTQEPLFVAITNERGQIVIPVRIREKYGIKKKGKVAVHHIERVD